MGDVHCLNCGEPWDAYHIRWDAAWDLASDLPESRLQRLIDTGRVFEALKEDFAAAGWEFGESCFIVLRCPCCKSRTPLRDALTRKREAAAAAQLLGEDTDGIQAFIEDLER
jgi:hypothetical protein